MSTEDQTAKQQANALTAAGCTRVARETASGATRARPVLNALLAEMGRGNVLVVAPIDRLARSRHHPLDVIETLESRGAGFRSLADPIDTTTLRAVSRCRSLGPSPSLKVSSPYSAKAARTRTEDNRPG